jgi:hypothetical protein
MMRLVSRGIGILVARDVPDPCAIGILRRRWFDKP